jgi:hypothetical protein
MNELREFLNHPINIKHFEIIEKHYKEIIEPLSFFKLIDQDVRFFLENCEDYLSIRTYFKKPDLVGRYRYYYFYAINEWIENEIDPEDLDTGVLGESHKFIIKSFIEVGDSIAVDPVVDISDGFAFNFPKTKEYLDSMPDLNERKTLLLKLKSDSLRYLATINNALLPKRYLDFPVEADIELKLINDLQELNMESNRLLPHFKKDVNAKNDLTLPTFTSEGVEYAKKALLLYFDEDIRQGFVDLLNDTRMTLNEKLVFKGNGNALAEAFKKMYVRDEVVGCTKKQFEIWIEKNFRFISNKNIKDFTLKYLNDIISGKQKLAKRSTIK